MKYLSLLSLPINAINSVYSEQSINYSQSNHDQLNFKLFLNLNRFNNLLNKNQTKNSINLTILNNLFSLNKISFNNQTNNHQIEIVLATQTIGDLQDENLASQILGNTNTKIFHKTIDPKSTETISKMIGTFTELKQTVVSEEEKSGSLNITGRGSLREVESFKVHPNDLKNLKTGEAYLSFVDKTGKTIVTEKIKIKKIKN